MKLAERRRAAGLTQMELARLSGVPWRTIQNYEDRGMGRAWAGRALALARALGCSVEKLLEDEDPVP